MGFTFNKKLPIPKEIKAMYPLSERCAALKAQRDKEIADVITGKDDRFLIIVGPCSADNETAVMDYLHRLVPIQEQIKDKCIIIPRIYTNKPRTTGEGYKGMVHQPDPEAAPDLLEGLIAIRKLHIRNIEETGLTAADEMLYPENWWYLADLLSYVAVGARSVEDQQHRMTVSGFDVPAGMKNPTSGDMTVMLSMLTPLFTEDGMSTPPATPLLTPYSAVLSTSTDRYFRTITTKISVCSVSCTPRRT